MKLSRNSYPGRDRSARAVGALAATALLLSGCSASIEADSKPVKSSSPSATPESPATVHAALPSPDRAASKGLRILGIEARKAAIEVAQDAKNPKSQVEQYGGNDIGNKGSLQNLGAAAAHRTELFLSYQKDTITIYEANTPAEDRYNFLEMNFRIAGPTATSWNHLIKTDGQLSAQDFEKAFATQEPILTRVATMVDAPIGGRIDGDISGQTLHFEADEINTQPFELTNTGPSADNTALLLASRLSGAESALHDAI